jgi:psiF repeat-containing protein
MRGRLIAAAGLAASFLFSAPAFAVSQAKLETCNFGADDQKLTGAARKSFMAKCMSNRDSPRGKPMKPAPRAQ